MTTLDPKALAPVPTGRNSILENCYLDPKPDQGGTPMFHFEGQNSDGTFYGASVNLDGYAIIPMERFDRLSVASPQPALAVKGLHGPFGWLNGCRGLSEDSWSLESDPLENNEEYFAIPLYALVDPFKEIGPLVASGVVEGKTYYTKGKDAEYFEQLSDKDFAWEITKASQDLNDSDENVSGWMPVTAMLSSAADRIAALVASPPPSGEVEALRKIIEKADLGIGHGLSADFICEEIAKIARAALSSAPAKADGWRNDPSADERWSAGLDYGQTQLCTVLGVDPANVSWDAATENLDGDVQSVISNILRARFGDDWRSEGKPVAWRVFGEPDLPVHFARTKADAEHLVNNLLTYRKGCTKAWAEPLFADRLPAAPTATGGR